MMIYILVIAVLGFPAIITQMPSLFHSCPNPTVVQNFNVSAYLGKWYEQEKYPIIWEIGGTCITAEYSLRDDGKVKVVNRMLVNGKESSIEGDAKLNSTIGEAKLEVTFYVPVTVHAPYWVIATDYSSYAAVWACQDLFGISATTVWILTREQNPPASLIDTAYAALKKQNISTTSLTKTEQQNCTKQK